VLEIRDHEGLTFDHNLHALFEIRKLMHASPK
jgi:hypothetical protein